MPEKEEIKTACRKCGKGKLIRIRDAKIGEKIYYIPDSLIIYQCTEPGCEVYYVQIGMDLIEIDEIQLLRMIAEVREYEVRELEARIKELEIRKGELFKKIWGIPEYYIDPEEPTRYWIKRAREAGVFINWLKRHINWAKQNKHILTEEEIKAIGLE